MAIGKDALNSLTGNIETAVLVIHDYREAGKNLKSGMDEGSALLATKDFRVMETTNRLAGGGAQPYPGSQDRILRVQFNPTQLTLDASAIPQYIPDAQTGRSRTIISEDVRKLHLTTVLYFDDMDPYDAFMWDRFTSGFTAKGAANAVKAGMTAAGKGKTHSVQWQVEALVAALRNPFTRTITFRWADFVFVGQLNTVKANYTMFSPSGRPIRAEVLLRIHHEMDAVMLKNWYNSFDTAFGGDTKNLVKWEQDYSSLLNLSL